MSNRRKQLSRFFALDKVRGTWFAKRQAATEKWAWQGSKRPLEEEWSNEVTA
jgi:hypothetical protein